MEGGGTPKQHEATKLLRHVKVIQQILQQIMFRDHLGTSRDKFVQAANRVAINPCRGWETSRTLCCNTARTTAQIPNERSLIAAGCKILQDHLLIHLMPSLCALVAMPRYAWMCCFCINQHRMGADDSTHFQLEKDIGWSSISR